VSITTQDSAVIGGNGDHRDHRTSFARALTQDVAMVTVNQLSAISGRKLFEPLVMDLHAGGQRLDATVPPKLFACLFRQTRLCLFWESARCIASPGCIYVVCCSQNGFGAADFPGTTGAAIEKQTDPHPKLRRCIFSLDSIRLLRASHQTLAAGRFAAPGPRTWVVAFIMPTP
jgi:hypothetical protein